MKCKQLFAPVCFICLLAACEPQYDFSSGYVPELVVEGSINSNDFARVYLSTSKAISSRWDSIALSKLPVSSAKVEVSDGVNNEILTGRVSPDRLPYFVYTGNTIRGVPGKKYILTITYQKKQYSAETVIPRPVPVDSFQIRKSRNSDTLYHVRAFFNNPSGETHYFKIFTRVYGRDSAFYNAFLGSYSDDVLAHPVSVIDIYRPYRHTELKKYTPFFAAGERVGVRFTTVSYDTFHFWSDYENEVVNKGNPIFPNTTNLPGNIPGALGIWAGYGTMIYTLKMPEP